MARTGIMGGTFNPIHAGHLAIARMAMAYADLTSVVFLPSGQPPHKPAGELASADDRMNMVALSIWGTPGFQLSAAEVDRPGTTYTVDTLMAFRQARPDDRIYYVIGGDTLPMLPTWKQSDQLMKYCGVIVAPRRGYQCAALRAQADAINRHLGVEIAVMDQCGPDISSTEVRAAAARGENLSALTPCADYIGAHRLYGAPDSPMAAQLRAALSPSRFLHTISVAVTAVRLAIDHGVDPAKAHLAGMLHDCAKGLDAFQLMRLIRLGGISLDEMEMGMPALLHAPAGVVLARRDYGVTDPEVLSAIRWHTTGRRMMTDLEKVVYLADLIEPTRPNASAIEGLRNLAKVDLDAAVRMAARQ
ncbi:MAG: nicotinate (nicotinamide) nucleotide adenylyltransferase, partial [Clostridiales bacterium]|nr:nicotinate (nicotinamide) nucleotide adenylyltransferase [Clostridiales bacterium]